MTVTISNEGGSSELNICNSNFRELWNALGLPLAWGGTVHPELVLSALTRFKPESLVVETQVEENCVMFGRTLEQTTRYYWTLRQIALEAKESGENIVWL